MLIKNAKHIGEMLFDKNLISTEDLDQALEELPRTDQRLGELLLKLKLVGEEDLVQTLSEQLDIPYIPLNDVRIESTVIDQVPARLVNLYGAVPLSMQGKRMRVATADPLDVHSLDELRLHLKCEIW